jgi:protein-S-isoprenylcysteine O-methyltransferase Ste14
MKFPFVALRSLGYMAVFFTLWGWVALKVRIFDGILGIILPSWTVVPGAMLFAFGAFLGLWCVGEFIFHGKGTPAPFDAPREFVASGPYRFVRNPMYIAGAALLAGLGLYSHSVSILLLSLMLSLLAHRFVVIHEEPILRKRFGPNYDIYRRNVQRWIPGRPRPGERYGP